MRNMFCSLCADILYQRIEPLSIDSDVDDADSAAFAYYNHHASLTGLGHAAAKGCVICSTLLNQLTDDQRHEIYRRDPDSISLSAELGKGPTPNTINFEVSFDPDIFVESSINEMLSSSIMLFQPVTGMLTIKLTLLEFAVMRTDADSLT